MQPSDQRIEVDIAQSMLSDFPERESAKATTGKPCPFKCGSQILFTGRGQLRKHLLEDCPEQKLKCSDCSKQVSQASKARHICVQGHQRLMKASTQGFKRQLKAKDAKLAAGDKLLAKKITEL